MNTRRKLMLRKCSLALALAAFGGGAQAAHFIYTGGHPLDDGAVAALGHSYTQPACFEEDDRPAGGSTPMPTNHFTTQDCWTAVFNGDYGPFDAIVFGEDGWISTEAVAAAVQNYVGNGGKFIFLDDHSGNTDDLFDGFGFTAKAAYTCKYEEDIAASMTPATAGTVFANGPQDLRNLSCTSGLETATLPEGSITYYAGETEPYFGGERPAKSSPQTALTPTSLVWTTAFGTGKVFWLGWDFCCSDSETQAYIDDWYIVLDNTLKSGNPGSANLRISFSGPSTPVRVGSPVAVYARLDNYGRNSAVNPVVNITASLPAANVVLASDPPGWLCSGDEQPDRAAGTKVLVDQVNITCRMAGSLPRTSLLFKLNVMPTSSGSGFHTFNGTTSSDSTDPVPGNNAASYKLYVRPSGTVAPVVPPRT